MTRTPIVVVLSGSNGAGKSTTAARLVRGALSVNEFVNADTIAQGLSAYRPESTSLSAGRVMLVRLRHLARVVSRVIHEDSSEADVVPEPRQLSLDIEE